MMKTILNLNEKAKTVTDAGIPLARLTETGIFEKLLKMKSDIGNDDTAAFDRLNEEIDEAVAVAGRSKH